MHAFLKPHPLFFAFACVIACGCADDPVVIKGDDPPASIDTMLTPANSPTSHGKTAPNYAIVFPQDRVGRIDITMTAEQWTAVRADMKRLYGFEFGDPTGGITGFAPTDPAYVDVSVTMDNKRWRHAGFRLKGNSSLKYAWHHGIYKLPFRMVFDEFEDDFPETTDQRFYGFKELSMSPGFEDNSLIHEKLAGDLFRAAGVPAASTAFYRVFIDFGSGPKYCGVYTMVEVIDDTMVKNQFGADAGNIYKPESMFRSFAQNEFEKKNNKSAADWSDVQALITALNSVPPGSGGPAWRASLESVFNVDHFLHWLAVSNAIVNWDSYGTMAHNYYLYNDPVRHLTWIPWDHNLAFMGSPGIDNSIRGQGLSLAMGEVTAAWPLIYNLMRDQVYAQRYRTYLKAFNTAAFMQAEAMADRYTALIAPYVTGAQGEQPGYTFLSSPSDFTSAAPALRAHLQARRALVTQYVP